MRTLAKSTCGLPLCFGVDYEWGPEERNAFLHTYGGQTAPFKNYTLGWIDQETLAGEGLVDNRLVLLSIAENLRWESSYLHRNMRSEMVNGTTSQTSKSPT